jgi:hypothetical protein
VSGLGFETLVETHTTKAIAPQLPRPPMPGQASHPQLLGAAASDAAATSAALRGGWPSPRLMDRSTSSSGGAYGCAAVRTTMPRSLMPPPPPGFGLGSQSPAPPGSSAMHAAMPPPPQFAEEREALRMGRLPGEEGGAADWGASSSEAAEQLQLRQEEEGSPYVSAQDWRRSAAQAAIARAAAMRPAIEAKARQLAPKVKAAAPKAVSAGLAVVGSAALLL